MKDLLNLLKSKYNYDDELLNFFDMLIPIMIEHFGYEYKDNIISAFIECPIIMLKTTIDKELGVNDPTLFFAGGGVLL